jgi:hypothetical protein
MAKADAGNSTIKAERSQRKATAQLVLTERMEEILKAIHYYRYMTVLDVANLLFSEGSKKYVGKILTTLAGYDDGVDNQYLYRFGLSKAKKGNYERVFTLGSKGRDFLQSEVGLPVNWHFRPEKIKHLSHGQLIHNLLLTRFLVLAHLWSKNQSEFKLVQKRISYELQSTLGSVSGNKVIPDAWLLFEKEGRHYPILLEIDRGTEYQQRFKHHIATRIEFIRSGEYQKIFGEKAVTVAYVTTGDTLEYRKTRLKAMQTWTNEVLKEQKRENWASTFRFSEVALDEVYSAPLFDGVVWVRPDSETALSFFVI